MPWVILTVVSLAAVWFLMRPPTQVIQIVPGYMTLAPTGAVAYVAQLPSGAQWAQSSMGPGIAADPYGNVVVNTSDAQSVTFTYSGSGGGSISLSWTDSTGTAQSTTVTIGS